MPYTHTTWGDLKTNFAERLADTSRVYWVNAELGIYLTEALRAFGLMSGFWRQRGTVTLSPSLPFYNLETVLSNSLLTMTVTDRDLLLQLEYMLLENPASVTAWAGTPQFTYEDLVSAITRYRDQFLADTGVVLTRSIVPVLSPQIGREQLSQDIIDVRRALWMGASPLNYTTVLWREDEQALTMADQNWSVNAGMPVAFSVMAPPPLQLQIAPPPMVSGSLDMLTVNVGPALDPAVSATVLGIPDDLTPAVKWGALSYLLSIDGQARDPARAAFAASRYNQYVQLARMMAAVVHAEINGVPLIVDTLHSFDAGAPGWQDSRGTPTNLGLAGWNFMGVYPVPDAVYSATFDVVRNAPIPTNDGQAVQIGQEQLDMIVEYAVHLALFKSAGQEFAVTQKLADEFLQQCITYNKRLGAAARYVIPAHDSSQREKQYRPRRLRTASGLGAVTTPVGGEDA